MSRRPGTTLRRVRAASGHPWFRRGRTKRAADINDGSCGASRRAWPCRSVRTQGLGHFAMRAQTGTRHLGHHPPLPRQNAVRTHGNGDIRRNGPLARVARLKTDAWVVSAALDQLLHFRGGMANLTCPECSEVGRLVRLPQEEIEFYWCGRCFVRWASRDERPRVSAARPRTVTQDRESSVPR